MAIIAFPKVSYGGIFSIFSGIFSSQASATSMDNVSNSQNIALLKAAVNVDPNPVKVNQMPIIVDSSSLLAEADVSGNASTTSIFDSNQITTYVVRNGDTLSAIAKVFGVTENTIKIANEMTSSKLIEGEHLIILPVSGIQHSVKKGETLQGIALNYKVSVRDILQYNHFESDSILSVGQEIFIPTDNVTSVNTSSSSVLHSIPSSNINEPVLGAPLLGGLTDGSSGYFDSPGFFIEPLVSYRKTQGLHGHNAVDLAAPKGTPIMAAAAGEVIISRTGWNGGYGNYVVIQHDNDTQTLYAHASKLLVSEGDVVKQGQPIALVGSTGESTGPHLHVEVRGGKNPF